MIAIQFCCGDYQLLCFRCYVIIMAGYTVMGHLIMLANLFNYPCRI